MVRGGIDSWGRLLASATICGLTFGLVLSPGARAASGSEDRASPAQVSFATAKANPRNPIVLAHLDEENVPSADNPGAPNFDGSAPDINPDPSADWQRVPTTGAPASANPTGAPRASAQGGGATGSSAIGASSPGAGASASPADARKSGPAAGANAGASAAGGAVAANPPVEPAAQQQPPTAAPGTSVQNGATAGSNDAAASVTTGAATASGTEEQGASLEPPPALDLGTVQSGPDLSSTSLADEVHKAGTPARAAALRVTEQARVELAAGKTDDALRDLGRAVSIDPLNPFEYFYLGRAYIARGNYGQALTFFKRAEIGFASRPDWLGETIGFEGACDEASGQLADGALAYQRALRSAPNSLRARVGFSRLAGYLPVTTAYAPPGAAPAGDALPPPERQVAGPPPAEDESSPAPDFERVHTATKAPAAGGQSN